MRIEIPDNIAEDFAFGRGKAHSSAEQQIRSQISRASICTCGHSRFWHGQEPGKAEGSGSCEDCACTTFEKAAA